MNSRFHKIKAKIISRLETKLKVDITYLLKEGSYMTVSNALVALSGFVLTIGLTHFLDQTTYGLYTYILSLAGIIGAFTLTGIDTAVTHAVARGLDRTLVTAFRIKCLWGIPPAALSVLVGSYYLYKGDETLGYSLVIIGLTSPLLYATSLYGSYLNGKKQFKKLAADNIFRNVLVTICMLTVAYYTRSVMAIVATFVLVSTIISVIRFWYLLRTTETHTTHSDSESISFGKHLSLMDMFSISTTFIDKVIVFQYLGAAALASYALALAPTKQIQGLSKMIRSLIIPKFAVRSDQQIRESMTRKFVPFFIVSVVTVIIYCIAAPYFFKIFFPKYESIVAYSQVLSLSVLFMPFILQTQALVTLNKTKDLYILHISKPFIKGGLLLLLVPHWGIWGAVYSLLLFYVVHYSSLWYLYSRK